MGPDFNNMTVDELVVWLREKDWYLQSIEATPTIAERGYSPGFVVNLSKGEGSTILWTASTIQKALFMIAKIVELEGGSL